MITQELKQGKHTIRIETATSPEDAKENHFKQDENSRYFVDDKPVASYLALIRFITEESRVNNSSIVNNVPELLRLRKEFIEAGNKKMAEEIEKVKEHFKRNMPEMSDNIINKLDQYGMRIKQ